ncbi:MAG: serine hydrolase [Emcibacteraceae bacterium]|nr:serine hydrolase [Emcibacteraceae bacterium]
MINFILSVLTLAMTLNVSAQSVYGQSNDLMSAKPEGLSKYDLQQAPHNRWTLSNIDQIFPNVKIQNDPSNIRALDGNPVHPENVSFTFNGAETNLDAFLKTQYADGIIVLKDGKVLVEGYYGALNEDKPHLMMSMTKSIAGVLAGIFVEKGMLDLSKTTEYYLPEMKNSGWANDTVRALLDMKDSSAYVEEFLDQSINGWEHMCASDWYDGDDCNADMAKNNYEFLPSVELNPENTGKFIYKSATTDVVGWILERLSGKSQADLIEEYIWKPMGAEHQAYITVDSAGFAMAGGGMNASLRDMARFGQMILNNGKVGNKQLVPEAFIHDAMNQPKEPTWASEEGWYGDDPYYRSFFWGVGDGENTIDMLGVNGQVVRIAPKSNMVIAIFSSWPEMDVTDKDGYGWGWNDALLNALIAKYRDTD